MIKKIIFTVLMTLCVISLLQSGIGDTNRLYSDDIPIDVDEVLTDIHNKLNFRYGEGSFSAELTIIHKDTDGEEEVKTAIIYRKDKWDKFMFIFTSPITEVGSGYLAFERNLWYYDSGSREWIRKTRRERYSNSNVETKDIEQNKYKPYYTWEYVGEDKLGKVDCYVLDGKAKFDDLHYPKQKIWIRKDNYLPIKEEAYTVSDVLARTAYMVHYKKLYDKEREEYTYIDDKRIIVRNIDKTQSVRLFTNISLKDLPDSMFSKAYFESQNRD